MKSIVSARSRQLSFNITPLIDVVFQLIIFFLAASHLARVQSNEEVSLPTATQGEDVDSRQVRQIVITVTQDGRAYLAGRPIEVSEFEALLTSEESGDDAAEQAPGKHVEVRFRVDERAAWGDFDPFLIACARAGVTQLGFKVLPR